MTAPAPPNPARVEAAAERLYALLPAHIRTRDAANGSALKALVTVLASGSVEIDREIDTLYDAMFVETAPEGALADLAALVAAEPLRPLPADSAHSARAFIANTVRYRRGKGTARVLEALANDVGGFGAVAVEYFMRLARTQSLIDVRPERPGSAMLVPGTTAARSATGFDLLPRLVDVRSIARAGGRHHVSHVGIHLLRPIVPAFPAPTGLTADALAGVPVARPWPNGATAHAGYFQLSAQPGRTLRLFNPDRRSQDDTGRVVDTDLGDRLRRLPLHLEIEELRKATLEGRPPALDETPWFNASGQPFTIFLRRQGEADFVRVDPREVAIANLEAYPNPAGARPAAAKSYTWFTGGATAVAHTAAHPIRCAFDPATGRLVAATPAVDAPDIAEVRIACGTGIGREIGAGPHERNARDVPFDVIDTDRLIHLVRVVDPTRPEAVISAAGNVKRVASLDQALTDWAAEGASRRGLIVLTRCDREGLAGSNTNIPVAIHPGAELHIVSAKWRAPDPDVAGNPRRLGYLVRTERRFTVDARLSIFAASAPPAGGSPGMLVLDGLELTDGLTLKVRAVSRLLIRHSTVRAPASTSAISTTARLEDAAIAIDHAIVGRINLNFGGEPGTGSLAIRGSIIAADGAAGGAIAATGLDARLDDVTILGTSSFKSLEATNVIFTGATTATRSQSGCVRYSSVAGGSSTPRRFRCQPDLAQAAAAERKGGALSDAEKATVALGVAPLFLDTSLDEPAVAMLHPLTRDAIRLGGENDAEMGAFSAAAEGLRMGNIASLFEDYVPFGLEAGLIDDTRSSAVATRRNRP